MRVLSLDLQQNLLTLQLYQADHWKCPLFYVFELFLSTATRAHCKVTFPFRSPYCWVDSDNCEGIAILPKPNWPNESLKFGVMPDLRVGSQVF